MATQHAAPARFLSCCWLARDHVHEVVYHVAAKYVKVLRRGAMGGAQLCTGCLFMGTMCRGERVSVTARGQPEGRSCVWLCVAVVYMSLWLLFFTADHEQLLQ